MSWALRCSYDLDMINNFEPELDQFLDVPISSSYKYHKTLAFALVSAEERDYGPRFTV